MDKIVLCTCQNDSAFGRLSPRPLQGFCPWTPLDTSVPRPILLYFWGWHGDEVEDEQLLRQSCFDIVAVFGDNVAGFGDNVAGFGDIVAAFGDIVAGVDGDLVCFEIGVMAYVCSTACHLEQS